MLNLTHKKLDVYIKSKLLIKEIYIQTNKFPRAEDFNLTLQMRRASVSVISNLSEGLS